MKNEENALDGTLTRAQRVKVARDVSGRKAGTSNKVHAWAWRSGLIEFGKRVPSGALPILAADGAFFSRQRISTAARHAYDGKTLLVPGLPEAGSDAEAYEAFERWVKWMRGAEVVA